MSTLQDLLIVAMKKARQTLERIAIILADLKQLLVDPEGVESGVGVPEDLHGLGGTIQ